MLTVSTVGNYRYYIQLHGDLTNPYGGDGTLEVRPLSSPYISTGTNQGIANTQALVVKLDNYCVSEGTLATKVNGCTVGLENDKLSQLLSPEPFAV